LPVGKECFEVCDGQPLERHSEGLGLFSLR